MKTNNNIELRKGNGSTDKGQIRWGLVGIYVMGLILILLQLRSVAF